MRIYTRIYDLKNLKEAWREMRRSPESRGVDDITISKFGEDLEDNLRALRAELRSKQFQFQQLKAVAIESGTDKYRGLKIATVGDRVVQKAILRVIYPYLNSAYKLDNVASYAYISAFGEAKQKRSDVNPKGVQGAVLQVQKLRSEGYVWVYQGDIVDFFGTIDKEALLTKVSLALPDNSSSHLIKNALNMTVKNELSRSYNLAKSFYENTGVAQGSSLAPAFSNVYMSDFDRQITSAGYKLIRYADDFTILGKTEHEVTAAKELAVRIIQQELGMKVHPLESEAPDNDTKKFSYLGPVEGIEFLGIQFQKDGFYPTNEKCELLLQKLVSAQDKTLSLLDALLELRKLTTNWGSTYFYTKAPEEFYRPLNDALTATSRTIMWRHDFKPANKGVGAGANGIKRIGLEYFDESIKSALIRQQTGDKPHSRSHHRIRKSNKAKHRKEPMV